MESKLEFNGSFFDLNNEEEKEEEEEEDEEDESEKVSKCYTDYLENSSLEDCNGT